MVHCVDVTIHSVIPLSLLIQLRSSCLYNLEIVQMTASKNRDASEFFAGPVVRNSLRG